MYKIFASTTSQPRRLVCGGEGYTEIPATASCRYACVATRCHPNDSEFCRADATHRVANRTRPLSATLAARTASHVHDLGSRHAGRLSATRFDCRADVGRQRVRRHLSVVRQLIEGAVPPACLLRLRWSARIAASSGPSSIKKSPQRFIKCVIIKCIKSRPSHCILTQPKFTMYIQGGSKKCDSLVNLLQTGCQIYQGMFQWKNVNRLRNDRNMAMSLWHRCFWPTL